MRVLWLTTAYSFVLAACATTGMSTSSTIPAVTAEFETPVMSSVGDSADDPAIYINGSGGGFIAATDKQAGLYIYNLDGSQREFMPLGMLNNVDLRDGFIYQGEPHVLLVASNDEINLIETVLYNPTTDSFITPEQNRISTGALSPYGICLGKFADGTFHAGLTTKAGLYEQHIISEQNGVITGRKVREFSTGKQTEGCTFDDRTSMLYVAEEEGGLYRYPASPSVKNEQIVIAKAGEYGMKADLEGVTIYEDSTNGGYVIVSSQGNNSFAVFSLPNHEFVARFEISEGAVDSVSKTDGIAVTSTPTPRFPKGFLVVQDDMDETSPSERKKKQNLKIIDWRQIEDILK